MLSVALHNLDVADGRPTRRFLPPRWWSMSLLDGLVGAILVWWHSVGANPPTTATSSPWPGSRSTVGEMANYYRWFGTPEAPFGWYYDLSALWTHMSPPPASGCGCPRC